MINYNLSAEIRDELYRRLQGVGLSQEVVQAAVLLRLGHLQPVHAVEDLLSVQPVFDAQSVLEVVVVEVEQELSIDGGVVEGL